MDIIQPEKQISPLITLVRIKKESNLSIDIKKNQFEDLYDSHSSMIYGLALSIVKQTKLAETVLQDVFISAYMNSTKGIINPDITKSWVLKKAVMLSMIEVRRINNSSSEEMSELIKEVRLLRHP